MPCLSAMITNYTQIYTFMNNLDNLEVSYFSMGFASLVVKAAHRNLFERHPFRLCPGVYLVHIPRIFAKPTILSFDRHDDASYYFHLFALYMKVVLFLSHLLVAGCDIGVRYSVRPPARPSVSIYVDVRHLCQS